MSAQPLNTDISIFRTIRSSRAIRRHDSVGSIIKRLRPLVMSVVGNEMQTVTTLTRNAAQSDFSVYARSGFPIVVGQSGDLPFAYAQEYIPNIDFAFQIGSDKMLTNTTAGLAGDLQGDERTAYTNYKIVGSKV